MNGDGARLGPTEMKRRLNEVWEWHAADTRTSEPMLDDMSQAAMQLMVHLGFDPSNRGILDDMEEGTEVSIVQTLLEILYRRLPEQVTRLLDLIDTLPPRREAFEAAVNKTIAATGQLNAESRKAYDIEIARMFILLPTEEDKAWAREFLAEGMRDMVQNLKVYEARNYLSIIHHLAGY